MAIFILTFVTGGISIIVGLLAVYDSYLSFRIQRLQQNSIPIKIQKTINYSQFYKGLERLKLILDESRFLPDAIIGIHYQGTSFAEILGKIMYIPVFPANVTYCVENKRHICTKVSFCFNPEEVLKDKKVLILDNSMKSGRTLEMVKNKIHEYTSQIQTVVVHRKSPKNGTLIEPDYVLFESSHAIQFLK